MLTIAPFLLLCSGMWSMVIYSWTQELQEDGPLDFIATLYILCINSLVLLIYLEVCTASVNPL